VPTPPAITDLGGERSHPIEHFVHPRYDIVTIEHDRCATRHAKRHVQHRSLFSRVDLLSAEHRLNTAAQPAGVGQPHEQSDSLVRDAVLRIVEI
jgi:hypothetical protein